MRFAFPVSAMRSVLWFFLVLLVVTGCRVPAERTAQTVDNSPAVLRADPGYVQWLEKQAMFRAAQDMARIVSGTSIPWTAPYVQPHADALLREAPVWLSLHPASMLVRDGESVFRALSAPAFWTQARALGVRGLMLPSIREAGSVWGYAASGSRTLGEDVVQYGFARYAGSSAEFRQVIQLANQSGAIMGDMLVPMDTGRGADFFLAARAKTEYVGLYGMVELPADVWTLLPVPESQWQGAAIPEATLTILRGKGVLPGPRVREALRWPMPSLGWAATGEVRGLDGVTRRFAYLFSDTPERPVLSWNDPSAAARRVLSGSIIQQIGTLGVAFSGISVGALVGVEPEASHVPSGPVAVATALDAARAAAQEVRRYGGWSFLRDALPLPALAAALRDGPDFAVDHAQASAATMALLTGDATLLRRALETLRMLGVPQRRLIHAMQPGLGVDVSLVPFYGAEPDGVRAVREAAQLATRAALTRVGGDTLLSRNTLYASPATWVALAAGIRSPETLTLEQTQVVRSGMLALTTYHAMQPGLFMLTGRELTGTLAVPGRTMTALGAATEEEALTQGMMGAYDLLGNAGGSLLSPMGVPGTAMAFGTIPEQAGMPDSFLYSVQRILAAREAMRMAWATPTGELPTRETGSLLRTFRLPNEPDGPDEPDDSAAERTSPVRMAPVVLGLDLMGSQADREDVTASASPAPSMTVSNGGPVSNDETVPNDGAASEGKKILSPAPDAAATITMAAFEAGAAASYIPVTGNMVRGATVLVAANFSQHPVSERVAPAALGVFAAAMTSCPDGDVSGTAGGTTVAFDMLGDGKGVFRAKDGQWRIHLAPWQVRVFLLPAAR